MPSASSVAPMSCSFTAFSFSTTSKCDSVLLNSLVTQKSGLIVRDDKGHEISCYFLALPSDTPLTLVGEDISKEVRTLLARNFGSRYPVEDEYKDSPADFAKEKEECDATWRPYMKPFSVLPSNLRRCVLSQERRKQARRVRRSAQIVCIPLNGIPQIENSLITHHT